MCSSSNTSRVSERATKGKVFASVGQREDERESEREGGLRCVSVWKKEKVQQRKVLKSSKAAGQERGLEEEKEKAVAEPGGGGAEQGRDGTGSLLLFHHQMADSSANAKCSDGVSYFDSSLKGKMTSHNNSSNSSSSSSGAVGPGGTSGSGQTTMVDRLKLLYPNVNEAVDQLPRSWSSQDKCTTIGLTQNNLRVHYKGFYAHFSYFTKVYFLSKSLYDVASSCSLFYI